MIWTYGLHAEVACLRPRRDAPDESGGVGQVEGGELGRLSENGIEFLARPLDRVLDRVREVLYRADRVSLLGRVGGYRVGLGHVRQDHLHVALGAESAALQQGLEVVDAAAIHVDACRQGGPSESSEYASYGSSKSSTQ